MIRRAFLRASTKQEGVTSAGDFLEAILRERPDLKGKGAYFPEQGANAYTVFIGNEVFKGPKDSHMLSWFDEEHKFLKKIEGKGLLVPKVTYVGKEAVFFGMTRMPGVELSMFAFDKDWTLNEQRTLVKEVIDFFVDLAQALPWIDGRLFAVHNDLHEGNILINPKTKKISAVLDFGTISYVDKDFWYCLPLGTDPAFKAILSEEYYLRNGEIYNPQPAKKDGPSLNSAPFNH